MPSMPNYIEDRNPFKLAGPPVYFLKRLFEFDNSLVIVPSRQGFYYRLTQRRKLRLPEHIVNDALFKESDTQMLASYGLVPVTTIMATANWDNPLLFQELAERAPWRQGGAEKVNKHLEEMDAQREAAIKAKNDDMINILAKDGWKYYRKKTGLGRSWHGSAAPTPKQS